MMRPVHFVIVFLIVIATANVADADQPAKTAWGVTDDFPGDAAASQEPRFQPSRHNCG